MRENRSPITFKITNIRRLTVDPYNFILSLGRCEKNQHLSSITTILITLSSDVTIDKEVDIYNLILQETGWKHLSYERFTKVKKWLKDKIIDTFEYREETDYFDLTQKLLDIIRLELYKEKNGR